MGLAIRAEQNQIESRNAPERFQFFVRAASSVSRRNSPVGIATTKFF